MSKLTQREAVYNAITGVLAEHGVNFESGQDVSAVMTKEFRGQVNEVLFMGFRSGTIEISKEFDDSALKAYASSLQSNWIRKDPRLNGGTKYVAKNPGSRAGSGDESLKAMRALLKTLTPGTEDYTEVETHISKRVSEISIAKAPKIDLSALPEALRNKFGN